MHAEFTAHTVGCALNDLQLFVQLKHRQLYASTTWVSFQRGHRREEPNEREKRGLLFTFTYLLPRASHWPVPTACAHSQGGTPNRLSHPAGLFPAFRKSAPKVAPRIQCVCYAPRKEAKETTDGVHLGGKATTGEIIVGNRVGGRTVRRKLEMGTKQLGGNRVSRLLAGSVCCFVSCLVVCLLCLLYRLCLSCLQNVFGVGSARCPDGPHQSGAAHGLSLIPVSGVVDEVKTRRKAENSGTPRSDMVSGWDDFRETHRIAQTS